MKRSVVSPAVLVIALLFASVSCKANCKDPKNAGNAACIIQGAIVDCTGVSNLQTGVDIVTPIFQSLIDNATDSSGHIVWSSITSQALQLAWKYGICVVAQVWNGFFPPTTRVGAVPTKFRLKATITPAARAEAMHQFDVIRQQVAPGHQIKLLGGGSL